MKKGRQSWAASPKDARLFLLCLRKNASFFRGKKVFQPILLQLSSDAFSSQKRSTGETVQGRYCSSVEVGALMAGRLRLPGGISPAHIPVPNRPNTIRAAAADAEHTRYRFLQSGSSSGALAASTGLSVAAFRRDRRREPLMRWPFSAMRSPLRML